MSIFLAVIIFGVLVFFHEFGHFIIAKKNGVRVIDFSFGMGPTIFSFDKGDTKYSLKILPFGGACQMLSKEFPGEEDAVMDVEKSFESKSVWSRMAIIFAGPVFNFVLAFVVALIVVGIVGYDPAQVLGVAKGSPADKAGLQVGDIITEYDGTKVDIGRDIYLEEYIEGIDGDPIKIKYERDGKEYSTTLKPVYVEQYMMGLTYTPGDGKAVMLEVTEDGPLDVAGFKAGDYIAEIDGVAINSTNEFIEYITNNPITEETMHIVAYRGDEKIEADITPVIGITGYETGLVYNFNGYVKCSPLSVVKYSYVEVKQQIKLVFKSLKMLFTGELGINDFSGPVGIVDAIDTVYDGSKEDGTKSVVVNMLTFVILLSANLGVMNLLPIPGLDGGRLLFLIIEAIKGKPVKHEAYINMAGMLLLMLFAMYILFKDIISLF